MPRINSKRKGKVGEQEFANLLKSRGHEARRGIQFKGGDESPDVISSLPVHFEVKRTEALLLYPSLAQAIRDSGGKKPPVVAHRRSKCEWVAVMRMSDYLDLLEQVHAPQLKQVSIPCPAPVRRIVRPPVEPRRIIRR